jgi:hypothetical protein
MGGPRTYSDAQNRAMDRAMLELSPGEAVRRAAAGALEDPDTGERLPAFTYNRESAAARKRRAARAREHAERRELPAIAQLTRAAETLAGTAHEVAAAVERKRRRGKLTPAELADAARALRETHRAVVSILASSSSTSPTPAPDTPTEPPSPADDEVAQWAADAAQS